MLSNDPNENAHFTLSGADPEMSEEEMLETDVTQRLYIDKGEVVRIRVEEDKFHDDEPGPPKAVDGTYIKPKMQRPHYEIIASMSGAGLGCVAWWAAPPDVDAAPS
ncbi:DNA-directed RNA polymerase III subunit rpc25 [Tulasnella sp. 408]|nr:DNA-directed RNA polymerase III subunit rpc25 [Tulasnella sp. 408]